MMNTEPEATSNNATPPIATRLLSHGNTKTKKGSKEGFLTWSLMLAPNTTSGRDVCEESTPGCRGVCLGSTGCHRVKKTMAPHIANAKLLFEHRSLFMGRLDEELEELLWKAERHGYVPCARLNNFSDLDWAETARKHPNIIFYDYTKRPDLMKRFLSAEEWPRNYHLTFSRSETNWETCLEVLESGGNVAVVFRRLDTIPARWKGFQVADGSTDDLRFLDGKSKPGKIVALPASPEARRDRTGFVVDPLTDFTFVNDPRQANIAVRRIGINAGWATADAT